MFHGRTAAYVANMIMLEERGCYAGEFGALRYQVGMWIRQRIDPTEDVSRLVVALHINTMRECVAAYRD